MVARRAHNPEVGGSSPPPATKAPECESVQDFYLLPFYYSLFTETATKNSESESVQDFYLLPFHYSLFTETATKNSECESVQDFWKVICNSE